MLGIGIDITKLSPANSTPPILDVDFKTTTLDSKITYSRSDTTAVASYYDATGVLRYGPTNLFLNSANLSSGYTPVLSTFTLNAAVSPLGTTTAATLIQDTNTGGHYLSNIPTVATNAIYTLSYHVKVLTGQRYVQLIMYDQTATANFAAGNFDLSLGTATSSAVGGTGVVVGYNVTALSNSWYRISLTAQPSTNANTNIITRLYLSSGGTTSFTGDGTSGIAVWGAQFERNTIASPFITTTSAVASGPRFDYGPNPSSAINYIRNSVMAGGVAGLVPTYMTGASTLSGITATMVGATTDANGFPAYDINLAGTSSATVSNSAFLLFESTTQIPALTGQTWTVACNLTLISGTLNGLSIGVDASERLSSGAPVGVSHQTNVSPTTTMTRFTTSGTLSGGVTTAYVLPTLRWNLPISTTINVTIRISQPQCEQTSVAMIYQPTYGAVNTQSVTNWIRNSTLMNAGITSTTPPLLWNTIDGLGGASNGISTTIVGTGTESGIGYMDVRWQGTASATASMFVRMETNTQIPASNGQTWTLSAYVRLIAGSFSNSGLGLFVGERDSAGTSLAFSAPILTAPTNAALSTQRYSQTRTNTNSSTYYELPALSIAITNGQVYDFTLRIGAPQMERSATVGTYVPTYGRAANSGATPLGLLIEDQRTNLLFPSVDMSGYSAPNATIVSAAGIAPDGTNTMTRVVETTAATSHFINKSGITVTGSANYVFSLFAKAAEDRYLQLFYDGGGTQGVFATFDLQTGTISGAATASNAGTATGAWIVPVGNGIYRCSVSGVASVSTTGRCGICLSNVAAPVAIAPTYSGNASNGLLVWGGVLEQGTIPSTYIPTTTAAIARTQDVATTPMSEPPNGYAFAVEAMAPIISGSTQGLTVFDDGTANNRTPLRVIAGVMGSASLVSGVATSQPNTSAAIIGNQVLKGAISANSAAATLMVSSLGVNSVSTAGAIPTGLTTLRIGQNTLGGVSLMGWVRRLRFWRRILPTAELNTNTT